MILNNVRRIAKEHGLSIFALEREAGLANGTISKWEKSSPSIATLAKVANVLNVQVEELINGVDKDGR